MLKTDGCLFWLFGFGDFDLFRISDFGFAALPR